MKWATGDGKMLYQIMIRKRGHTTWVEDESLPRPLYSAETEMHRMLVAHGSEWGFKLEPIEEALA